LLAADQAGEQLVPPSNRATELRVQAEILAKSGDFITADEMFVRSIEFAHADADPQAWDWSLLFIATAQARAGSIYAGLETAGTIQTEAYQVWALRDIAPMQAASGDVDGALGTAASIPEEDARAHALGGIAIARARVGDLDRAAVIAGGITEPGIRARAYTAITRARVLSGR
jgi:hypothetical protein